MMARSAADTMAALCDDAVRAVQSRVTVGGNLVGSLLDREQRAAHGLAWMATYVEAVRQLADHAERLQRADRLGEVEELIIRIGIGEYLARIGSGIAMSQTEIVRPSDLGLSADQIAACFTPVVQALIASGNTAGRRMRLVELMRARQEPIVGDCGLDATLETIRDEMRSFTDSEVAGLAQRWHIGDALIPMDVIGQLAELGVFGLTVPEAFGGMGLGKEALCVVTEELSRGSLGVGSLSTRSEIAAELILHGGTDEQKQRWLPRIASGEILPTAVFTEPDIGSDLASVRTRAVRSGLVYRVYGSKAWITHAARADLMTLLVRTDSRESGHRGLSILLAEKPRGTDDEPFPANGMAGTEIPVIGYRGMKEYEIAFDGFEVKTDNLLGGIEGLGFRQLMQTFESARIQTAARAVGVAQAAMEEAFRYAQERRQFGRAIIEFPRIADKIAMMAVEVAIARQLAHFAAREKDSGRRCDRQAGMAKLLAARVAWACADDGVQVHGGSGFATESAASRLLCDARILSIFEGSAEIQAQVIARRLIENAG